MSQIHKHHFNRLIFYRIPVNLKSGFYFYSHFNLNRGKRNIQEYGFSFSSSQNDQERLLFGWILPHLKIRFNTLYSISGNPLKVSQAARVRSERCCWPSTQSCWGFAERKVQRRFHSVPSVWNLKRAEDTCFHNGRQWSQRKLPCLPIPQRKLIIRVGCV